MRLADLDELMLVAITGSLDELEADFLGLETEEVLYRGNISGLPAFDLFSATDADGGAFDGFDTSLTWALALRCTTCVNPAPPFFGVLEF